jgi:ribonuclease Z
MRLKKYGLNLARVHHIFISHLHGDHVFGLFGLLSSLGMMGRKVPLHLYGPLHFRT